MASKYVVEIHPRALVEIEEAYCWWENEAPQYAPAWFNGLFKAIGTLETNPERCPAAPESMLVDFEVLQLLHGKGKMVYRILYTLVGNTVRVLHVRHASRKYFGPEEL